MSPQAMADAYAPCVAVWFLFQTHQFRRPIGSRVDHSANCPFCMVGIRPRSPSLAKAPCRGCSAHSSLWVCRLLKTNLPFPPVLHGPRAPVPGQIQFLTCASPLRLQSISLPSTVTTLWLLHSLRFPVGAPLEITWWLPCKKH